MICLTLGRLDFQTCRRILDRVDLAEIRLDLCDFSLDQVHRLFSEFRGLIATCRAGRHASRHRARLLLTAIRSGADYIDLDCREALSFRHPLQEEARERHCRLILSYHDHRRTPARSVLEELVDSCLKQGGDIAKIACRVHSEADCARLLSLYDRPRDERRRILALGMGQKGRWTRIAAPLLGAPFTFAVPRGHRATAAGQLEAERLQSIYQLLDQRKS